MKYLLIVLSISLTITGNAQDYLISFAGTGASNTVSTVKVENLTRGTSKLLNGSDVLHLTALTTEVSSTEGNKLLDMKIYPNPMTDNSILQIYPPVSGDAIISVCDITGKIVTQIKCYLENSTQEFRLSDLQNGIYIVNIMGNSYQISGKVISIGKSNGTTIIEKISSNVEVEKQTSLINAKGVKGTVDMEYTTGDILKFTAVSGDYSTVTTAVPDEDSSITFDFVRSVDGDGNNYPVVKIGGQLWMAENLKTTKYNDLTDIHNETVPATWTTLTTGTYCDYDNTPANSTIYGRLYNWYAVDNNDATKIASNGGKNVCPTGWHVPNSEEWTTLVTYVGGESVAGGKLKEAGLDHWLNPNFGATNAFGFTGLPGGNRFSGDGLFYDNAKEGYWWSSSIETSISGWAGTLIMSYQNSNGIIWSQPMNQGFSVRCLQNGLPTVTSIPASSTASNFATSGGNVTSEGGDPVTDRGVCWSTSPNPTTDDSKTSDGTGAGEFTSSLTGLTAGTTYYLRAYAINTIGTAYGDEQTFSTTLSITDVDGNIYNTVIIGTQTWMVENLKTTKYNDGTEIPLVEENSAWIGLTSPGYCWYGNDATAYGTTYGALYNWYAVKTINLCPVGWHVPTDAEWNTMVNYLGGTNIAGGKLKEEGNTHWLTPNTGATNETGFTAIPGGVRIAANGEFNYVGSQGNYWSSTEDWDFYPISQTLYSTNGGIMSNHTNKLHGFSLRCIIDTPEGDYDGDTYSINDGDCDDTNPEIHPGATEACGDGIDQDCDGNDITCSDPVNGEQIADYEGNTYNTVIIGTQTWMAENLTATKYNDGTDIPLVTDNSTWDISTTPAYCWYNNDYNNYGTIYGAIYNWYAVNTGKLCPVGWHVPSSDEWAILTDYLGGREIAGGKLKETGTIHWTYSNARATNETGFTALPGGIRSFNGEFGIVSVAGNWWSSTDFGGIDANIRQMSGFVSTVSSGNEVKERGFSVRCLQNGVPTVTTIQASSITNNTATSGGNVSIEGGTPVTDRGICWNTSHNPTTDDSKTSDGTGLGEFTSSLTGLTAETTYYVRAYAINSDGTAYGDEINLTTTPDGTPTLLEITVLEYYEEYPVENASVRLYPSITDWDNETNLVTEGFTNINGIVVFSNLEPIVYYVDVWEQGHDNYLLRSEDIAYIRTPEFVANQINRFTAWVDKADHTKGRRKELIQLINNKLPRKASDKE